MKGSKELWKRSKPCHVGIHWIALSEYSHMSTHVQGFQSFFRFLHLFVMPGFWTFYSFFVSFRLAKLATSSIMVKSGVNEQNWYWVHYQWAVSVYSWPQWTSDWSNKISCFFVTFCIGKISHHQHTYRVNWKWTELILGPLSMSVFGL